MSFTTGLAPVKRNVTKEDVLQKAKDLVTGDRNDTHGDAFNNHAEIAEFWNIFLDKKLQAIALGRTYAVPSYRGTRSD
jgi:zona occludens toxin (predicted ATPase)